MYVPSLGPLIKAIRRGVRKDRSNPYMILKRDKITPVKTEFGQQQGVNELIFLMWKHVGYKEIERLTEGHRGQNIIKIFSESKLEERDRLKVNDNNYEIKKFQFWEDYRYTLYIGDCALITE